MLKDLIKEGGIYTLANLFTKGVSLLLLPFYAGYFSTAEYGMLSMLSIAGGVSTAIFSFQIYQGIARYITEKGNSLKAQQKIGSTGLWFTVLSFIAFIFLAYAFRDYIISTLSEDERIEDKTYIWSLFAVALNCIFYTLANQLKFLRKTKEFSLTSFLNAILNIVFVIILTLGFNFRVESIFMASIFTAPLVILLQVYFLRKYLIFHIDFKILKKLLKFSSPLVPASLAYLILNLTDRFFIKEITGSLTQVGIYDMGFKFTAIVSIIIVSFQSALNPLVYEKHQDQDTQANLGKIMRLFITAGTLGVMGLALFSYETLFVFTKPKYYEAATIMPLFYLTLLITSLNLFSPGINIKKKTNYVSFIYIFSGLLNVVLNFYLIPIYGLLGAAIATLISTLANSVILFTFSQKLYPIPFEGKKIARVLFVFICLFFVGSYLDHFLQLKYGYILSIKIAIITTYIIYLIRSNFINFNVLTQYLNSRKKKS